MTKIFLIVVFGAVIEDKKAISILASHYFVHS